MNKRVESQTEDQRNIKVLRMHAGICSKAVKVEIEGPALKEQAKIFNGAADTIERLLAELEEARRCKHPTKRGTGSISTDGKIVTSELWCDTCGEKLT